MEFYQQTASTAVTDLNIHVWPSSDFATHIREVEARLECAAGIAAQALLGELDQGSALEAVVGLAENCRRHLRAAVGA